MDLLKMGQELLGDKLGDNAGNMMQALSGLTSGEGLDLGGIASKLSEGGLSEQVSSWLGDGDNAAVSPDQIKSALGDNQISEMASKLGMDADATASQLSEALPALLDKSSSGGSILDQVGGIGGALNMAKGLFNK